MRLRKTAAVVVAGFVLVAALAARQEATTGPLSRKVTKEDKQGIDAFANGGRRATFDPQPDRVTILVRLSDGSAHRLEVPAAPAVRGTYKNERLREAPRPLGPRGS